MPAKTLCLLVFALSGLVAVPMGADEATPPAESSAALDQRVDRLERELTLLREDVAALRQLLERSLAADRATADRATADQAMTDEAMADEAMAGDTESAVAGLRAGVEELAAKDEALGDALEQTRAAVDALSRAEHRRTRVSVYGTFTATDPEGEDSTFDAEAFEIVLSGQPSSRLGFFAEIEFERAASVGGERGGEILVEQAFASYTLSPWANLRAGVVLVPFGNVNVDHYAPARDVISKPLVSYVVTPSDWTDNGVGVQGGGLLGDLWSFDYELYLVAGLDQDITGLGTRAARQSFGEDNNDDKAITGRFAWNRLGSLELGTSLYSGKYDDAGGLGLFGWGFDANFRRGPWTLTGEYDRFLAEQHAGPDARLEGWYVRGGFDLTPAWLRRGWHGTAFPEAKLTLVGQVDDVRITGPIDGVRETNSERRFTLGLVYRPNHQWVLKWNVEDAEAKRRPLRDGDRRSWLASIGFQF